MPASRMKRAPFCRVTLPSLNLPTRIFGPCRSHMIATVRPTLVEISFTSAARLRWSSALPWEKLRRTTSTPARTMRSSTAGSLDAGPRVATIFVLRNMKELPRSLPDDPAALDDRFAAGGARLERKGRAFRGGKHGKSRGHEHHAREPAAHAPHRACHDAKGIQHLRNLERQGGGAVQVGAGQP